LDNGIEETLFFKCVMEANERWGNGPRSPLLPVIRFVKWLAEMPVAKRLMLEASIAGTLVGWEVMGQ